MADAASTGSMPSDHAHKMDRMYRTQRHIYDLTRKYYLLGRDHTIANIKPEAGQTVLEIGCGTGRNLALIARTFPQAKLFGLDISQEMLAQTRKTFLRNKVRMPSLVAEDALLFRPSHFNVAGFDRILISYSLSMIPDWETAVDVALAALAPGGSLHIVDFGQQERLPHWFGRLLRSWLSRFHVTPRAELKTVLETLAAKHGMVLQFEAKNRGYAWTAVISARLQ